MVQTTLQKGLQQASQAQAIRDERNRDTRYVEPGDGDLGKALSAAGLAGSAMGIPGAGIASALGFGIQSAQANQAMGFGNKVFGPGILSALANTIAGKAMGMPDVGTMGSTVSALYGPNGEGMFGGADPDTFTSSQIQTTGFGRGATPSVIDAVYGTAGGGSGPIDHAANVASEIAKSNVNAAMADVAQSTGQSPMDVPGSGDKGMGFALKEGGMVNSNTPLKKLFMGIYE